MAEATSILEEHCKFVILDDRWYVDEYTSARGNRTKYTAVALARNADPLGQNRFQWMWKASLSRYPVEFWSEVLAYHIGTTIGVKVPPCFPSVYNGRYGALMLLMVDKDASQELIQGGDLLQKIDPTFDRVKGAMHSIQLVTKALVDFQLHSVYRHLFRQFVFDALIGNSDRHQDNWALLATPDDTKTPPWNLSMFPAFDNGSSLGRELTEDKVIECVHDPTALDRYIDKGCPHIRWEDSGQLRRLSHEDLLSKMASTVNRLKLDLLNMLDYDQNEVHSAICRIGQLSRSESGPTISVEREQFIIRLIKRRCERIRELINK